MVTTCRRSFSDSLSSLWISPTASIMHIEQHICCNSKHRLPFIVCQPSRTNFRFVFSLQQTNRSLPFPFSVYTCICVYFETAAYTVYIYIYIFFCICICISITIYMLLFQTVDRKWKPSDFP
jgi:hypothetical protein